MARLAAAGSDRYWARSSAGGIEERPDRLVLAELARAEDLRERALDRAPGQLQLSHPVLGLGPARAEPHAGQCLAVDARHAVVVPGDHHRKAAVTDPLPGWGRTGGSARRHRRGDRCHGRDRRAHRDQACSSAGDPGGKAVSPPHSTHLHRGAGSRSVRTAAARQPEPVRTGRSGMNRNRSTLREANPAAARCQWPDDGHLTGPSATRLGRSGNGRPLREQAMTAAADRFRVESAAGGQSRPSQPVPLTACRWSSIPALLAG
jgi:hypothetical protein